MKLVISLLIGSMQISSICFKVLNLTNLDKAYQFAKEINQPPLWAALAKAQLNAGLVKEAVESFIKADDPSAYIDVTRKCNETNKLEDLIRYLQMAHTKKSREFHQFIVIELCLALAKMDRLKEFEEFSSELNNTQIQQLGDRCIGSWMNNEASILFSSINNFDKQATVLNELGNFSGAINAALKANSTKTWKQVDMAYYWG